MRLFSARLDIKTASVLDGKRFNMEAIVIDNTGMYFANEVKIGDIIYVSALEYGYDVFRYQVSEITSAKGATISCIVTWDMPYQEVEPIAPLGDAIIGARHMGSTTANIVDTSVNLANEKLIADARNYQQILTNVNIMNNSSLTPDKACIFTQNAPSSKWEIKHDMKKHPSVSVVDDEGMLVMCDIQYLDIDNIVITFPIEFSGCAYLN